VIAVAVHPVRLAYDRFLLPEPVRNPARIRYGFAYCRSKCSDERPTLYPKKVAKPDAIKAILNALKKHDKAMLLKVTAHYAEYVKDRDENFIPYPQKWFNKERYNDHPSTWLIKEYKRPPQETEISRLKIEAAELERRFALRHQYNRELHPAESKKYDELLAKIRELRQPADL